MIVSFITLIPYGIRNVIMTEFDMKISNRLGESGLHLNLDGDSVVPLGAGGTLCILFPTAGCVGSSCGYSQGTNVCQGSVSSGWVPPSCSETVIAVG